MTNDEELPVITNRSGSQHQLAAPTINMNNAVNGLMVGNNPGTINVGPDQAQVADIVRQTVEQMLASGQPVQEVPSVSHSIEWNTLNRERFNVFVLENEEFNCNIFYMSKAKSMEQYTEEEDYKRYRMLTPEAVIELCSMPCIFAKRNHYYNRTDDSHPAFLGKIRAIKNQGENIRFEFEAFQTVSQQTLNENVVLLGIAYAALRNEFDEEHWSIKRGNLIQALANLGIEIR